MTESKKIVIIGGGVAGLSCGCYLRMNGFDTEILEASPHPGGLCAAWTRGDYTFEGCLHWLVGTSPASPYHRMWRELGVLPAAVVDFDELLHIEVHGSRTFHFYTDIDALEKEMMSHAPEDRQLIKDLTAAVRAMTRAKMPIEAAPERRSFASRGRDFLANLPFYLAASRWARRSVKDFAAEFNNPVIKEALFQVVPEEMSAIALVTMLAWMHTKDAGYLVGGSKALVGSLEKRYRALGGELTCDTRVTRIIVKDGRAAGVVCEGGREIGAEAVVSAADGYTTIFKMLGGAFADRAILDAYNTWPVFPALMQISVGVNRDFHGAPHAVNFPLQRPLMIDTKNRAYRLSVRVHQFDPTLAPKGKTAVTVLTNAAYEYWANLRANNPHRYKNEKERIVREIIGILDNRLGDIAAKVEVYDVATPATYVRYTGNWQGSYEGWLPTPAVIGKSVKKTLPGLAGLYLAGQWVEPGGGLPPAALSGRQAAQLVCDQFNVPFTASEPQ